MVSLTAAQQDVLDTILEGSKNVLIIGASGTGKSTVVHSLVDSYTAFTDGTTLGNFLGMSPIYENTKFDEILTRMLGKPEIVKRIHELKRLVIDHINIVSNRLLNFVRLLLEHVRRDISTNPYGGVQMVLVGDFTHLPPLLECEPGASWSFIGGQWDKLSVTPFMLTQVFRDQDPILQRLIGNALKGHWSSEDSAVLDGRKRRTQELLTVDTETTTFLCVNQEQADNINREILGRKLKSRDPSKNVVNFRGTETFSSGVTPAQERILRKRCRFPETVTAIPGVRVKFLVEAVVKGYNFQTKESRNIEIGYGTVGTVMDYGKAEYVEKVTNYGMLGSFGREVVQKAVKVRVEGGFDFFVGGLVETVEHENATLTHFQYPLGIAFAMTICESIGKSFIRIHIVMNGSQADSGELFYAALCKARYLTDVTFDAGLDVRKLKLGPHSDVKAFYASLFSNSQPFVPKRPGLEPEKTAVLGKRSIEFLE